MQAEANILERFSSAYVTYRATRLLCLLALPGAALLLLLLSGGFPPWAWRLLFQALPQMPTLLALRGQDALLAMVGLTLLSVTILLAWWLLLWLAWRMLTYWLYERRELRQFAADMQEAQYLAQDEEEQHTARYSHVADREDYEYDYLDEEEAYEEEDEGELYAEEDEVEPGMCAEEQDAFWAVAGVSGAAEPSLRPVRLVSGSSRQEPATVLPHAASRQAPLPFGSSPELRVPMARASIGKLQSLAAPVHTSNLQQISYGLSGSIPPAPSKAPRRLPPTDYEHEDVPTTPLPLTTPKTQAQRPVIQLVVSTGLDEGLKRKGKPNEDSLLALQNTRVLRGCSCPVGLFVIADGMGGHGNGQEASRLVIQSLSSTVVPSIIYGPTDDNYAELLAEGIHHANLALYQRNRAEGSDMGTTVAAALLVNTTAYITNVGDSRVYLYRAASGLSQVTRDHSTVARLVEMGLISPDDVYTHPRRNEIYRSLGHHSSEDADKFILTLQPGDLLLLCSDGLWEMVRDAQIQRIIEAQLVAPAQLSSALVQAALDGGGKDNVSVIAVYVSTEAETS